MEPQEAPPRWEPLGGEPGTGGTEQTGDRGNTHVFTPAAGRMCRPHLQKQNEKNWNLEARVTKPWTISDVPSPWSKGTLMLCLGERAPPPWNLSGTQAALSFLCRDGVKS